MIMIVRMVVAVQIVQGLKDVMNVANVMVMVMTVPHLARQIYIRTQIAMAKEIPM